MTWHDVISRVGNVVGALVFGALYAHTGHRDMEVLYLMFLVLTVADMIVDRVGGEG